MLIDLYFSQSLIVSLLSKSQKRTIKPYYVAEMLAGFIHQGGNPDQLLAALGFSNLEEMSNQLINVSEFHTITQAIEQALGDEMLGFFSVPVPFGSREFINRQMTQLPSLGVAIDSLNRFYALFNNGHSLFEVITCNGRQGLQLSPQRGLQSSSAYFMQRMLLTAYKQLCWLAKTKIGLVQVEFACSLENGIKALQHVFACDAIQQSDHCRLIFSEAIVDKAAVQSSEGAELFSDKASFYTLLWPNLDILDIKIRLMIGKDIANGFPKFDDIAQRLQISPQTLSRRLHEEGTSYQSIKDDIRRETALALLSHSKLSIKEIAFKLGFQESSAFSKSFKNWFGITASAYREQALAGRDKITRLT